MKVRVSAVVIAAALLGSVVTSYGQAARKDAIWARSTAGAHITMDGRLNEAVWSKAESMIVKYRVNAGNPGSGWKEEGGILAKDSTLATLKLLTDGDTLWLGAYVHDKSVGGSDVFNRFDGFIMALKDHVTLNRPAGPDEYTYTWWWQGSPTPTAIGRVPGFAGKWAKPYPDSVRTLEQVTNWNATTLVDGLSNSDTLNDVGYTVEMKFALVPEGYNVTQSTGDVVEWNISLYDTDYFWPINVSKFSANRTWWESPWGNAYWYDEVHIFCRPDVTVNSGVVPTIQPEVRIANAGVYASPSIDGALTEPVWNVAPSFDIKYGDDAVRNGYPGVGKWRSGQYQPTDNGGVAAVVDPGDATVKMFFKADTLFMGFDVRDQVVQYVYSWDRQDGFTITLTDPSLKGSDNQLLTRRLTFVVGPTGAVLPLDQLIGLRDTTFAARVNLQLKPGTTVDTLGTSPDVGYTAELALDLHKLGYASGLGDGSLWIGVDLLDGDSFTPFTDSYGTRAWWFRESEGQCCPPWAYMDPSFTLTAAADPGGETNGAPRFALRGVAQNPVPSRVTPSIRYSLAQAGDVTLDVFDVKGRLVATRFLGMQNPGEQMTFVYRQGWSSGVYAFRITQTTPGTNGVAKKTMGTLSGKFILTN